MADLSLIPEEAWREAQRRAEVIRPLAERGHGPRHLVRAASVSLGLSERQTYTLLRRCREAEGALTALLPGRSGGGRGRTRLDAGTEALLRRIVEEGYLSPQKRSAAWVVEQVLGRCRQAGMALPSPNTVRRRLKALSPTDLRRRGEEYPEVKPVHGHAPPARHPLDVVQVDHTPMDLVLVDPLDREPIGRPWVTVAIDTHSRCIAGFHVTLEAPSATSVGLCLTHMAMDKAPWLALRGVEADWPVAGKPRRVGVDNAAEFHSAAFERGCAQHGIAIDWRPPGRPQFGGIVERVIGTLMGLVHGLPGTTFSDIGQRGAYDSDKAACLTLDELERWLAVAIAKYYHLRPHEGLGGQAPLRRWQEGVAALAAEGGAIPVPRDPRAYLMDFLPVVRRTLRRDGIRLDHITYFSSALRAWIVQRDRPDPLLIRRDPRDLSRVFVLDPKDDGYLEVPTRDLSRPAISLWEHRLALRRVRARHRGKVDEAGLYAAVGEMRAMEREATRLTRSARRDRARRDAAPGLPAAPPTAAPAAAGLASTETVLEPEAGPPQPFDDIEQW
ncbi:Mu transposase C-terminal domain-containing protein [Paeniroseomonas aquatica]|uniref:DDE-type integrase/transposase/recombinase n=1 Tax=Paeniroseomonas aquatica TaxID=373043 RepID=A0ABT7ZZF5_9PROT|nr:Mu transposase C-terminal domain-containing protein [Paeniroseomonas aquatica]MDN3562853.1 DDE-type integrase/transposase/recombinase [Paeniroseomonas aquatica]